MITEQQSLNNQINFLEAEALIQIPLMLVQECQTLCCINNEYKKKTEIYHYT